MVTLVCSKLLTQRSHSALPKDPLMAFWPTIFGECLWLTFAIAGSNLPSSPKFAISANPVAKVESANIWL
jgi:hypothetical protein